MLAEALILLPPLAPWHPDLDLDDPLYNQGFRSFNVYSRRFSPKKIMLEGRRQDVKAVFEALPAGSLWYVSGFKEDWAWSRNLGWNGTEHFLNIEEPRPALTSILIDQIMAWSNAICERFYTSNTLEQEYRNIFGKELRMRDVFLI